MYIPPHFQFSDDQAKIAFMKRYSFATMITGQDNVPIATHLPFVMEDSNGGLVLSSHFALANKQVQLIEENPSLVIFAEPHAYISPAHYDRRETVPTWDYLAVHAYGKARIIEDEEAKTMLLEKMIAFYDRDYLDQWRSLSEKFKTGMMKGIVAFDLKVTELIGQKKLSQNKTALERDRIVARLEKSNRSHERDIAAYIRNI